MGASPSYMELAGFLHRGRRRQRKEGGQGRGLCVSLSFLLGDEGENGVWVLPPWGTSSLIHTPSISRP
jgi:hypothetical protein